MGNIEVVEMVVVLVIVMEMVEVKSMVVLLEVVVMVMEMIIKVMVVVMETHGESRGDWELELVKWWWRRWRRAVESKTFCQAQSFGWSSFSCTVGLLLMMVADPYFLSHGPDLWQWAESRFLLEMELRFYLRPNWIRICILTWFPGDLYVY